VVEVVVLKQDQMELVDQVVAVQVELMEQQEQLTLAVVEVELLDVLHLIVVETVVQV
jgi:hypothetical protein